tara:strand:+ start:73 stop:348 length:276 start_codon:yes stop_codon:yes gene_type:complete
MDKKLKHIDNNIVDIVYDVKYEKLDTQEAAKKILSLFDIKSFTLTDTQIEVLANSFSQREQSLVMEMSVEWLLSHAFQLGMKTYRDLVDNL